MIFTIASSEFEAKRLFGYIKFVTRNFEDPMFTKLKLNIPQEFYNKIKCEDFEKVKRRLIEIIKSYSKNRNKIKQNLPKIREKWRKSEKEIFKVLKEVTGHDVKGKFTCKFLVAYYSGGYDKKRGDIWIYSNGSTNFHGIIHELFHVHYWKIWNRLIKSSKSNYEWEQNWRFSEVVVELVLRDTKIKKFLPILQRKLIFWNEVQPMAKRVLPLWENRKSFDSFLIESFKKLKLEGELK